MNKSFLLLCSVPTNRSFVRSVGSSSLFFGMLAKSTMHYKAQCPMYYMYSTYVVGTIDERTASLWKCSASKRPMNSTWKKRTQNTALTRSICIFYGNENSFMNTEQRTITTQINAFQLITVKFSVFNVCLFSHHFAKWKRERKKNTQFLHLTWNWYSNSSEKILFWLHQFIISKLSI